MPNSGNDTPKVYTVGDWIAGCVNFAVPKSAITHICKVRKVDEATAYDDFISDDKNINIKLLKADLYKWIVLGPGKVNNTSDADNGWSHSDGGYTLTKDDKKLLMDEANEIYAELEPDSVFGKKKIRMRSLGIMRANVDVDGEPLERNAVC